MLGIFVIIAFFVLIMVKYSMNGFYLPFAWKIFTVVLAVVVCGVGIVIGVLSDGIGTFIGFSITYFSIMGFMALYCL
jgi:ribosomal protein L44E